jgi:hypothetical protein
VLAGLDERSAGVVVGQLFEEVNIERADEVVSMKRVVERPLLVREQVRGPDRYDRVVEPAPEARVVAHCLPKRVEVAVSYDKADADRAHCEPNVDHGAARYLGCRVALNEAPGSKQ